MVNIWNTIVLFRISRGDQFLWTWARRLWAALVLSSGRGSTRRRRGSESCSRRRCAAAGRGTRSARPFPLWSSSHNEWKSRCYNGGKNITLIISQNEICFEESFPFRRDDQTKDWVLCSPFNNITFKRPEESLLDVRIKALSPNIQVGAASLWTEAWTDDLHSGRPLTRPVRCDHWLFRDAFSRPAPCARLDGARTKKGCGFDMYGFRRHHAWPTFWLSEIQCQENFAIDLVGNSSNAVNCKYRISCLCGLFFEAIFAGGSICTGTDEGVALRAIALTAWHSRAKGVRL